LDDNIFKDFSFDILETSKESRYNTIKVGREKISGKKPYNLYSNGERKKKWMPWISNAE